MGVRTFEIRTRQWATTTRLSKDSSAPQQDNRTSTTTLTAPFRIQPRIPTSERHNHRVLQVRHSIYKVGTILKRGNTLRWRPSANGHWSIPQRQRQEQRIQRKEQRKRLRQVWLEYRQRKRKVWRKATIPRASTRISNWTRKRANEQPVQSRQRQRKRQGKRKANTCYRCGQPGHYAMRATAECPSTT